MIVRIMGKICSENVVEEVRVLVCVRDSNTRESLLCFDTNVTYTVSCGFEDVELLVSGTDSFSNRSHCICLVRQCLVLG